MSDFKKTHGALGKTDIALVDPDLVELVTDRADPLYDDDVHMPDDHPIIQRYKDSMVRRVRAGKAALIEPIVIGHRGFRDDDKTPIVPVIAGRKRVIAARLAKRELKAEMGYDLRIAAMVAKKNDDASCLADMIEENTIRTKKNPVILAEQLARAEAMGLDADELLGLSGFKTKKTLDEHLELARAPDDVKQKVADGSLRLGAAVEILRLPPAKRTKALDAAVESGGKVHAAKSAVAKERGQAEPVAKWQSKRAVERLIAALEEKRQGVDPSNGHMAEYASLCAALASLRWVLGDEDAFVTYPMLRGAKLDADKAAKEEKVQRGKAMAAARKEAET